MLSTKTRFVSCGTWRPVKGWAVLIVQRTWRPVKGWAVLSVQRTWRPVKGWSVLIVQRTWRPVKGWAVLIVQRTWPSSTRTAWRRHHGPWKCQKSFAQRQSLLWNSNFQHRCQDVRFALSRNIPHKHSQLLEPESEIRNAISCKKAGNVHIPQYGEAFA